MTCLACRHEAARERARPPYPLPGPPRGLSFDLSALVADFEERGRRVQTDLPVADLREPWVRPPPPPAPTDMGFEDGVPVPIIEHAYAP